MPLRHSSGLCGARDVVKSFVVLAALLFAGLALGGCSSTASNGTKAYASAYTAPRAEKKTSARDPWTLQTPFGILYSETPRQTVAYQSNQGPGTIIVDTKSRYLYYVLGQNKALRYSIAVGREGYGWSGVSTVASKLHLCGFRKN